MGACLRPQSVGQCPMRGPNYSYHIYIYDRKRVIGRRTGGPRGDGDGMAARRNLYGFSTLRCVYAVWYRAMLVQRAT